MAVHELDRPTKFVGFPVEQYDELHKDLKFVRQSVEELKLMTTVTDTQTGHLRQSISRAFERIEKLEAKIEKVRDDQQKNSWVPTLVSALVTAGAVSAAVTLLKSLGGA